VLESVKGYLKVAEGLTQIAREQAAAISRQVLASTPVPPAAADGVEARGAQVAALAEEVLAFARANGGVVIDTLLGEAETLAARLGRSDAAGEAGAELDAALLRIVELEAEVADRDAVLREIEAEQGGPVSVLPTVQPMAPRAPTPRTPTEKSTAAKSAAKKSTGVNSAAARSVPKTSAAKKATAKSTAAKKATAKRTTAKKATAKKATAKKTTAKKTTANGPGAGRGPERTATATTPAALAPADGA
jgi:hypothetical protein